MSSLAIIKYRLDRRMNRWNEHFPLCHPSSAQQADCRDRPVDSFCNRAKLDPRAGIAPARAAGVREALAAVRCAKGVPLGNRTAQEMEIGWKPIDTQPTAFQPA